MKVSAGHLTYCTNIHAGESWDDHFAALKQSFPIIKSQFSADRPMGIGLRLSNQASLDLIDHVADFREWLTEQEAYVFTMNGFPFGGFHHTRVKDQVHTPDWTTVERVNYTLRLFNILARVLPHGMDGGISTSPLSYRRWFTTEETLTAARRKATNNILAVAGELYKIWERTGVVLHLDIEPEPDGILESGREFIDWFEKDLLIDGLPWLSEQLDISSAEAADILRQHICLCYDVCHFAVGYEKHGDVINELLQKGIKVGKVQISAALKARLGDGHERKNVVGEFGKYNESTYLHQVVAKCSDDTLIRYPDLSDALLDGDKSAVVEWRSHFHVPIFEEHLGALKSTQADIIQVLDLLVQKHFTNHLEVETYTWEVLPEALKLPLTESVIREMNWVKSILQA
jgi:hypothetical protein